MKKQIFITTLVILSFVLSTTGAFAQESETLFDGRFGFTGIWVGPKYNFSYFEDDFSYVRGGHFGFEFGKTLIIGWSGTRFRDYVQVEGLRQPFQLDYSNFMLNFTPKSYRAFHPIIGFQFGGGKLEFDDEFTDNERVFIVQPSAGAEINIFKWFRIGLEGGYRHVTSIDTPGFESSDVSSLFAQINLKFGFSWGNDWEKW